MTKGRVIVLMTCLLLLAACGSPEAAPTPIPLTPTGVTTGDPAAATPTAAVGTAANATLPPPPTLAAAPTNAPAATDLPPAEPTPAGVYLVSPADFGDNRSPLTGEIVADPSLLQRRPLAIKISNAPASFVRPQSGLNDAALIFEHTSEGSVTRFTAIFYGKLPPRVGPVRSARLIDVELPAMYDAALAFSGASVGVNQRLNSSDFTQRIIRSNEPGYFRTGENKPFEHTLYGDPQGFYQALDAKGENRPPQFGTFMAFGDETPAGGQPASGVTINYQSTQVEWRYDPAIGRYRRWADGQPHQDGNTLEQVTAANVIILAPVHVEDGSICEEIRNNQCVALSVQIQLWGSGAGAILRDGQQYPITWHRQGRNDMLTFTDSQGNPFPLQIGNSWVQLIPTWAREPVLITP